MRYSNHVEKIKKDNRAKSAYKRDDTKKRNKPQRGKVREII